MLCIPIFLTVIFLQNCCLWTAHATLKLQNLDNNNKNSNDHILLFKIENVTFKCESNHIARSSEGIVYKCSQGSKNKIGALKIIPVTSLRNKNGPMDYIVANHIRNTSSCCRNVITVDIMVNDTEKYYFFSPFLNGNTIKTQLEKTPDIFKTPYYMALFIRDVSIALHDLHTKAFVVFRDLHIGNVMSKTKALPPIPKKFPARNVPTYYDLLDFDASIISPPLDRDGKHVFIKYSSKHDIFRLGCILYIFVCGTSTKCVEEYLLMHDSLHMLYNTRKFDKYQDKSEVRLKGFKTLAGIFNTSSFPTLVRPLPTIKVVKEYTGHKHLTPEMLSYVFQFISSLHLRLQDMNIEFSLVHILEKTLHPLPSHRMTAAELLASRFVNKYLKVRETEYS